MHQSEQLRERTKQFAIRVVHLFRALPKSDEAKVIGRQVLRAGTSVAADYRAVCRSRSKAEFISQSSRRRSPLRGIQAANETMNK